jgi:hypothetical protein
MTLPAFEYPVVGIGRRISFGVIQGEELREFRDEKAMRTCDAWALDHDALVGMRLVDGTGRSWRIRGVERLRLSGNLLRRVIAFLCRDQWYDIELDVVEAEPFSFDELKARICKLIDDHPEDYNDIEGIVGEPDPPQSEQELLERRKAKVRKAKNIAEILEEIDASV